MTKNAEHLAPEAIAILGLGSMGRAILAGLLAPEGGLRSSIRVTNTSAAKAAEFDGHDSVTAFATELDAAANANAVRGAKVIIAAVKPWQITELLAEISDALEPDAVVVSVAAGVTTASMEAALPASVAVIRAMPNTPALVRKGVTGLSAGSRVSTSQLELVRVLFGSVGKVVVVPEEQLDDLSALSGSGPAYVFYFIEQLIASAVSRGFSEEDARTLVLDTFAGAAELLAASGDEPAELRRRVTSPNGTTERAIEVFDRANLAEIFDEALTAAVTRSKELAAEN